MLLVMLDRRAHSFSLLTLRLRIHALAKLSYLQPTE